MNWDQRRAGGDGFELPTLKLPSGWWRPALLGFGALLVLLMINGGFYTVNAEEEAVVMRFGRFIGIEGAGLHFKIPLGIDQIVKIPTKRVLKQEFGFVTEQAGVRSSFSPGADKDEAIILTGDLNVADVEWVVQYRIADPRAFLFNVEDVVSLIRDMSQSVMRTVIGDKTVNEVLTIGRKQIELESFARLQTILDGFGCGVQLTMLKLQNVNPPEEVKASFNDVNKAKQDKEKMINEANQEYNKNIPKARGEAEQMIEKAHGYALDRVNRSMGDASQFSSIWEEYRKAKEVTRKRLYLEAMLEFLPKVDELYVIDEGQRQLLPLLDLTGKGRSAQPGGAR